MADRQMAAAGWQRQIRGREVAGCAENEGGGADFEEGGGWEVGEGLGCPKMEGGGVLYSSFWLGFGLGGFWSPPISIGRFRTRGGVRQA